jgi:hypothetical protein
MAIILPRMASGMSLPNPLAMRCKSGNPAVIADGRSPRQKLSLRRRPMRLRCRTDNLLPRDRCHPAFLPSYDDVL